jgi:cell pole-organizing protein PopZ
MANPSTAHEPSMEEILASIRQIISEDGEAAGENGVGGKAAPRGDRAVEDQSPRAVEYEARPANGEPMKPHSSAASKPAAHPAASEAEPPQRQEVAQASPGPHTAVSTPRQLSSEDAHLLSDQSDDAVSGAFSALAHTILAQNARTLEDLVAEMLKPMLKGWLDDNLPSLVERLVQEEIHRVSRGRR